LPETYVFGIFAAFFAEGSVCRHARIGDKPDRRGSAFALAIWQLRLSQWVLAKGYGRSQIKPTGYCRADREALPKDGQNDGPVKADPN
jgi:hypothetical protein